MNERIDGLVPFLTEVETAQLLRIDPSTLARWARAGSAPIVPVEISPGVRRYRRDDLARLLNGKDR